VSTEVILRVQLSFQCQFVFSRRQHVVSKTCAKSHISPPSTEKRAILEELQRRMAADNIAWPDRRASSHRKSRFCIAVKHYKEAISPTSYCTPTEGGNKEARLGTLVAGLSDCYCRCERVSNMLVERDKISIIGWSRSLTKVAYYRKLDASVHAQELQGFQSQSTSLSVSIWFCNVYTFDLIFSRLLVSIHLIISRYITSLQYTKILTLHRQYRRIYQSGEIHTETCRRYESTTSNVEGTWFRNVGLPIGVRGTRCVLTKS